MNDLAGTGSARSRRFAAQTGHLHDDYRNFFRPKVFALMPLSSNDYNAIPRFEWREEPESQLAGRIWPGLFALGLVVLALLRLGLSLACRGLVSV